MTQKIIFEDSSGGIVVLHPTGEVPIDVVARKDVPQDTPYKIIDVADVPTDRTFRAAWEADLSQPDGYGDPEGYWAEQAEKQAQELAQQKAAHAARVAAELAKQNVATPEPTTPISTDPVPTGGNPREPVLNKSTSQG